MVNNMRDIDEDRTAGKITLAVILGKHNTYRLYQVFLYSGIALLTAIGIIQHNITLMTLPLLILLPIYQHLKMVNAYANSQIAPSQLAPQLKKIVLITLINSIIYSLSQLF